MAAAGSPEGSGWHRSLCLVEEAAGLVRPEPGVRAVEAEQFLVGALLDDPPVVEDDQLVHARDRAQPVRDDQRGPALHEPPQRLLESAAGAPFRARSSAVRAA